MDQPATDQATAKTTSVVQRCSVAVQNMEARRDSPLTERGGERRDRTAESGEGGEVGNEKVVEKKVEVRRSEERHGEPTRQASGGAERGDGGLEVARKVFDSVKKELVVNVEIDGPDQISMIELLKAVDITCGRVLGCRAKEPKKWELTMGNIRGKERLLDGFKIKSSRILASEVIRNIRVVSFLNLPLYVTDEQIKAKLQQWGVEPASDIRRRKWTGTDVFDGTRYLKVKFPDQITSLPYSTKFETLEGLEYFRVLHDQQVKVCRLCLQPGHILRDCPEFFCFKCKKQGHYARECEQHRAEATGAREENEEEEVEEDEGSEAAEGDMSEVNEEDEEEEGGESAEEAVGEGEGTEDSRDIMETPSEFVDRRAGTVERRGRERSRSPLGRGEDSGGSLPCGQVEASLANENGDAERQQETKVTGESSGEGKARRSKRKSRKK